jgi:hypothetical protein
MDPAAKHRIRRQAFERFGGSAAQPDHAGNLFGIPTGEDPHVLRA